MLSRFAIPSALKRIVREQPGIGASEREIAAKFEAFGSVSGGIDVAPKAARTLQRGLPETVVKVDEKKR